MGNKFRPGKSSDLSIRRDSSASLKIIYRKFGPEVCCAGRFGVLERNTGCVRNACDSVEASDNSRGIAYGGHSDCCSQFITAALQQCNVRPERAVRKGEQLLSIRQRRDGASVQHRREIVRFV